MQKRLAQSCTTLLRRIVSTLVVVLAAAGGAFALIPPAAQAATAFPAITTGVTWYVSASAHSNPACALASKTNPFATVAGALACAGSGDVISVGKGTFAGPAAISANVTVTGAGAATVLDDPSAQAGTPIVTVATGLSVTIEKLTVDGGSTGLNGRAGVVASSGALHLTKVTIENTTGVNGAGLDVQPGQRVSGGHGARQHLQQQHLGHRGRGGRGGHARPAALHADAGQQHPDR